MIDQQKLEQIALSRNWGDVTISVYPNPDNNERVCLEVSKGKEWSLKTESREGPEETIVDGMEDFLEMKGRIPRKVREWEVA